MSLAVAYNIDNDTNYMLSFEDDGYYWYMHPYFEKLLEDTGIYIDLYGYAQFNRGNINQIEITINQISSSLINEKQYFNVYCGTQIKPIKKDIYKKVSKVELASKLDVINEIIETIKNNGGNLVFEGD